MHRPRRGVLRAQTGLQTSKEQSGEHGVGEHQENGVLRCAREGHRSYPHLGAMTLTLNVILFVMGATGGLEQRCDMIYLLF